MSPEDSQRLAFELNGIILAADTNFVLHDDPAVLDLPGRASTSGSEPLSAEMPGTAGALKVRRVGGM